MKIKLISIAFLLFSGCIAKPCVLPSDRDAHNQTWYYDCCDPGLSSGNKEMCDMAAKDDDHILWDTDGNKYVFTWSDCKIGEEPWRKWE